MAGRSRLAPFRAALRFARRDAWAAKARSALIVAMVAIPVAGLSGVALVGMSMVPTSDETLAAELGQPPAVQPGHANGPIAGRFALPDPADAAADV